MLISLDDLTVLYRTFASSMPGRPGDDEGEGTGGGNDDDDGEGGGKRR
jgi:hypothetical protein